MSAGRALHVIKPEFVEFIPEQLQEGVLYVSTAYATAVHRCCCGCGLEVVTPLSPTDWKLSFDGEAVSLWPSIGNWSFPCRSHYWIKGNRIQWSGDMPDKLIAAGRARDRLAKAAYFGESELKVDRQAHRSQEQAGTSVSPSGTPARTEPQPSRSGYLARLWARLRRD